jgi:hypothetical protein
MNREAQKMYRESINQIFMDNVPRKVKEDTWKKMLKKADEIIKTGKIPNLEDPPRNPHLVALEQMVKQKEIMDKKHYDGYTYDQMAKYMYGLTIDTEPFDKKDHMYQVYITVESMGEEEIDPALLHQAYLDYMAYYARRLQNKNRNQ